MKKQGRFLTLITALYILEDIIVLNLLYLCLLYAFGMRLSDLYQLILFLLNLGYTFSFVVVRVDFDDVKQLHIPHLIRRNFFKLTITALILIACLFFLKSAQAASRLFIFTFFSSSFLLMTIFQWITRKALTFTIRQNINKGIILGAGIIGKKIRDEMERNVYNGVVICGFFDDKPSERGINISGSIEDAKKFILKEEITHIFCTLPPSAEEIVKDFIRFSEKNVIKFHIVASTGDFFSNAQPVLDYIGKIPVFVLRHIPLGYEHNALIKRCVDVVISLMVFILIFPVLFPILSILIKLSSPGPIFFKQQRTGRRGKEFCCYKFRTMRCSADAHTKQATVNDDRKTKIGNFLRRTSLDELPQFFNVLVGNMSLVGPRPHMLNHTFEYSPQVDKYMVRHFVKPGITGHAQVLGYRGETKDITLMENRIKADVFYVENWSLMMDINIILKTALLILKGDERAY